MKPLVSLLLILNCAIFYAQIDFLPAISSTVGSDVESVTIGDVNNDGLNDAIAATQFYFDDENDYHIFVFLQNQDETLAPPVKYPYPDSYGSNTVIKAADVNNDGLIDVVIGYDNHLGIYFQNDSGELDPVVSFFSGYDVDGIGIGDLNNDSLNDIAVCHWNDDYIKVFYQTTNNEFTTETYAVDNGGRDEIDVADVNGDDLDDIIFMPGQASEGTLYIFYQDMNDGIDPTPTILNYLIDSRSRFNGFGIGDLNNDGRNDIVGAIGGNTAWIALIYQDENGQMGEATFIDSYDIPTPVEIGDLNCDGKNEIVVGHTAWSRFSVFEQDSLGNYNDYVLFGSLYYVNPYGLALGDYNSDSRLDVLTTSGSSTVYFVYNNSIPDEVIFADTTVNYEINSVDTNIYSYDFQCDDIDTVNACIILTRKECTRTAYHYDKHLAGDSTIERQYEICGNFMHDTLIIEFDEYIYEIIVDTTFVVLGVDTLVENYTLIETYSVFDTLDIRTEQTADTLVLEEVKVINDTVYLITDSLFVESLLFIVEYKENMFEVYEGIKCGELIVDTILDWVNYTIDKHILTSDTTLISHTESEYPLGIYTDTAEEIINLYPNPASNMLNIECDFPFKLEICSLQGELLMETQESTLDISRLQRSVYVAIIKDQDGNLKAIRKFIKK
jgi:hypothetical protein